MQQVLNQTRANTIAATVHVLQENPELSLVDTNVFGSVASQLAQELALADTL